MAPDFFKITLNKIVIAKAFGIPLLIADLMFNIFSYFHVHVVVKVLALIAVSYSLACAIDYSIQRRKKLRKGLKRKQASHEKAD